MLFTNQGVIIPGLGGFVSEYEPAAFDVNENKFLPPSKKIIFKVEYSYHDNLLIDFISKKEKTDKENSKILLNDFVETIKLKLKKGEVVDFPGIGSLTLTAKGKTQFKQDPESNFLTDSFGLKKVRTKPSLHQHTENNLTKIVNPKKSYKKLIILSSSIIVFICLVSLSWYLTEGFTDFGFLSFGKESKIATSENKGIYNAEKNLDSIAKADSIKAIINQSIDENTDIKDALFYEETEKEPTHPTNEDLKPKYSEFHIIAGSFKKIKNAEIFSYELKNKGYNPQIIQSRENLYRIAIFTYTDETKALKELYKLRQNPEVKSVWILKII